LYGINYNPLGVLPWPVDRWNSNFPPLKLLLEVILCKVFLAWIKSDSLPRKPPQKEILWGFNEESKQRIDP
jgi:hypothetical protein